MEGWVVVEWYPSLNDHAAVYAACMYILAINRLSISSEIIASNDQMYQQPRLFPPLSNFNY